MPISPPGVKRDLTAELLDELGRCSVAELSKMFGISGPVPVPTEEPRAEFPHVVDDQERPERLTEAERVRRDCEHMRWDAEGRRIRPHEHQSSFPRRYEPQRRPGTHWSG